MSSRECLVASLLLCCLLSPTSGSEPLFNWTDGEDTQFKVSKIIYHHSLFIGNEK